MTNVPDQTPRANEPIVATTAANYLNKAQIAELEKSQTLFKIVYTQFKEHKAAVIGAWTILVFVLIALSAPLIEAITGLDADSQNVFNRYKPPMSHIQASSDTRETTVKNFLTANPSEALTIENKLIESKAVTSTKAEDALYDWAQLDSKTALAAIKDLEIPKKHELSKMVKNFETLHVLGTDELGRDVLMRIIYGTQVSMGVGILVALASAFIGLIIGALAGFYGGWVDTLLMRVTDALLSLPVMPVLIVVAAIDLQKLPFAKAVLSSGNESILKLVFILCLFSWMTVARLVRGSILSLREREFVLAAKTLGATDSTIMIRHMFPNVIAPLLVSVTLGVGESILFEAALSYLGLGIQPPTPSWGNMLFNAQELIYQAPYLAIIPGVLIFLVTISFNFVGDGLQDAIDPKSIRR
ncbi:MAG: ABC transporter permease [Bdellovibrio sp.]|nr:ABC transporter permease [Bdellovibrio sp.]